MSGSIGVCVCACMSASCLGVDGLEPTNLKEHLVEL